MRERARAVWEEVVCFLRAHSVELYVVVAIVVFVIVLFPTRIIINIPAGDVGVMWRRFQGGTDLCTVVPEGLHLIFPWDAIVKFDGRLQERTVTIKGLTNNGLEIGVRVLYRYQLIPQNIPVLYEYAGANYGAVLFDPVVEVVSRNVISQKLASDIFADRPAIQDEIRDVAAWNLFVQNDPTNLPLTMRTPPPNADALIDLPTKPDLAARERASARAGNHPIASATTLNTSDAEFPEYVPSDAAPLAAPELPHKGNYLPCASEPPVSHFVWMNLESVLLSEVVLPKELQKSITQTGQEQQLLYGYYWKERVAAAEADRRRTEAAGVRDASTIMSKGLTDAYLRYEGIEATKSLAQSPNAKVFVIGGGRDGLPLVFGADSDTAPQTAAAPAASKGALAGPLSPQQYLEKQLGLNGGAVKN
jgi:regulator of protease activity HflC (stomatin/prohibitin superfamily)